ncbi:MAG: hypothetical protein IJ702_02230 [Fretibacterium sp.]|nr:hypothetical protein [Fretibacterium sp.]
MYDNEQPQAPLDPTTARIVSELASRLVPELTQALAALTPAGPAPDALEGLKTSLQSDLERLAQTLKDGAVEEAKRRLELTNSLVAAFDELASLRGLCEVLAKSVSGAKPQELAPALEGLQEALSRTEEQLRQGLEDAAAGRKEVLNAVVILTEAITALRAQRAAPRVEGPALDRSALDRLERAFREGAEAERAGRQALLQPISSMVEEMISIRGQLNDALGTLRALKPQGKPLIDQIRALLEERPSGQQSEMSAALMELSGEVANLGKRTGEALGALSAPDARLSKLMEDAFPNWEGILRAHSQAQTHELDALSQELSALQKEAGATLLQTLQESVRQEIAARDEEWEERLKAGREEAARRMGGVKKALWALAGLWLLSLLAAAASFVR